MTRTFRSGYTMVERHRHTGSYLALVLRGGYEEAGDRGCFSVREGDVVLHDPYEAHLDRYHASGAEVVDLLLPFWATWPHATMTVTDPDAAIRALETSVEEALEYVLRAMQPVCRAVDDWPHQLATAIGLDPHMRIDEWAFEYGLAEATVSRGFRKVFHVSPKTFRGQQRARRAARLAACSRVRLDEIAQASGFSDQAHMTKAVVALTGQTPGAWRKETQLTLSHDKAPDV
ncbi:helix-turn-helix domain-containing protein [Terriglobus sp. ADX1]|uniref:helix-turn-helix domain-containing protein n=1 Tax=Terriglobus sp. ADX1 TaxID=2794063 RepID=UPI002FE54588